MEAKQALQADLAAVKKERATLLSTVFSLGNGLVEGSPTDSKASCARPEPSPASCPAPAPPMLRKLSWGTPTQSRPPSKTASNAPSSAQPAPRTTQDGRPSSTDSRQAATSRASSSSGTPENQQVPRATSAGSQSKPVTPMHDRKHSSNTRQGHVPFGSSPKPQPQQPPCQHSAPHAAPQVPMEVDTASHSEHPTAFTDEERHACTAADHIHVQPSGAFPFHNHSRRLSSGCSGATEGAAPGPAGGVQGVERAVRDQLLREVLSVLLGARASHVDHYTLSVQTVKDLADQSAQRAVTQALQDASAVHAAAMQSASQQAEAAARAKLAKELEVVKATADQESKVLREQLSKVRQEMSVLTGEKRDLMAKVGKQGRGRREAEEELQAAQTQAAAAKKELAVVRGQISAAERAKGEAERRAATAQQIASEAVAAQAAAEARLADEKRKWERRLTEEQECTTAAVAHAERAERAVAAAEREHGALVQAAQDAVASATAVGEEVMAEARTVVQSAEEQVASLQAEMATVKAACVAGVREIVQSARGLQHDVQELVASARGACQAQAAQVLGRVDELLQMDRQLASLGPQGLEGLCNDMQQARSQLADSSRRCSELEVHLADAENARQALQVRLQLQQAEVAMLVKSQAELQRELTVSRQEAQRLSGKAVEWQSRHEESASALKQALADLSGLQAKCAQATADAVNAAQLLQAKQSDVAALQKQLCQVKAEADQQLTEQQRRSEELVAALQQRNSARLRRLRENYFRPVGPFGDEFNQQGCSSGDRLEPAEPCGGAASAAVQQAKRHVESVVGLGLCQLSHEQVMQRLQQYCDRQRDAAEAALQEGQAQGGLPSPHRAAGACRLSPDFEQLNAITATQCSTEDRKDLDGMGRELLWLEGCILLMLVQLRQAERELADVSVTGSSDQGGEGRQAAGNAAAAQASSAAMASSLVSQMLRAVTSENRRLQQQVATLTTQASAVAASDKPFFSYLPLRRSVSARAAVPDTLPCTQDEPHAESVRPQTVPCGPRSLWPSVQSEGTAPATTLTAAHSERMGRSRQAQQGVPQPDVWAASRALGGEGQSGPLAGITARRVVRQNGLSPGCSEPATRSPTPLHDLDDDVLQVMHVLDDSALRASRGMTGVAPASALKHKGMSPGHRGILTPPKRGHGTTPGQKAAHRQASPDVYRSHLHRS